MIRPATFLLTAVAATGGTRGHHFVTFILVVIAWLVLLRMGFCLTRERRPKPQDRPDSRTDRRRA
jgi:hypothetical protein